MRKCVATVSVSGTLTDKLDAIAAAGFDGVEIFENDLLTCPLPPEEVRRRAADLGLSIEMYQPFRDFEAMPELDLRRAEHKFRVMERLGAGLLLVCSNVSPRALDDDELAAEQLRILADRAAGHGIRVAYEALAWGRHVHDYLHSWRIVRLADHPALGVCLDSFHILSRGPDPIGVEAIPADKIFFLQLADAPILAMDVLQWSRHYRCFPGQGGFDLPGFLSHVLAAGYRGPLSLEVFNDHFRQADARRTAVDAMRSLIALEGAAHPAAAPDGFAFAELTGADLDGPRAVLAALGFTRSGTHGTEPAELWEQGRARIVLNHTGQAPALGAIGLETPDPAGSLRRAESLIAPPLPRERAPGEAPIHAVTAPDGTQVFFCRTAQPYGRREDFTPAAPPAGPITHIDHIALTQPWHHFEEAELFYRSVLRLRPQESLEVPDPYGLLRSRAMTGPAGGVRMVLNVAQVGGAGLPAQHIALACDDLRALARRLRAEHPGLLLPIPANYYDDLAARHGADPELRELGVLYDRDEDGEFLQLYTLTHGRVFIEVVQRIGGYQGYGAANAPIRLAAQRAH
ncbi:bifunctional sugar phosphate isomerase/epimerase/4-hydroxyphenylpyruvate dioxygenase family protein [Bailinhaonella thermotolerans]|uniref:3-dehydroshikimate dehydratase n=1 Tax=Bailinhaonella thermotolerans TaxID=1070861 RepID=A0A3A4AZF6_9ACTN|nr:sugar phosphate isomerase/epimerase and 4-hydroxyphenylpyruvate domain-containing protein [Bailinhaonella thermotolerans]RJL35767.1 sugar phosphate isomerase/epimerase and 4-hydroxyphenylpyruvate domain-containing protein [Bailinhaonella thermotolerans]